MATKIYLACCLPSKFSRFSYLNIKTSWAPIWTTWLALLPSQTFLIFYSIVQSQSTQIYFKRDTKKKWNFWPPLHFMKETSERIIFFSAFSTYRNINMILLSEITFKIGLLELNLWFCFPHKPDRFSILFCKELH